MNGEAVVESDIGNLIRAAAGVWDTFWGKVLILVVIMWSLLSKHTPDVLGFLKSRAEASAKAERDEHQDELSHIDHLRRQAKESREAFTVAVESRIAALEDALQERNAKIEELVQHKLECNSSLARLEEKYRSLSERLAGYGQAVDRLRSEALDREKSG